MEAFTGAPAIPSCNSVDPLTQQIKERLLKKGVSPTPKIIHTLRKKHLQKTLRKSKRLSPPEPLTQSQEEALSHESYFQTISQEYRDFTKAVSKTSNLVGKPWEPLEGEKLKALSSGYEGNEPNFDGKLKFEHLRELGLIFEERKVEALSSFLDDDIELEEGMLEGDNASGSFIRRRVSDAEAIRILVDRLSAREITRKDWKFTRMMKQSQLPFTENQLLRILGGLGDKGCWKQAMEVVDWVYSRKEHRHYKRRFVYTKLLAVLGNARKPHDALRIFKQMREDCHIYPDMAAYHSIAVTLGQAGMVRELMTIIEHMKEKPSKIKNMHSKSWDPTLQPDIVVFNSVLNACVPSHHWKGVSWVFEQIRKYGLKPNSATYGLAMEVMQQSSKYDLVHELFQKMAKNGKSPNALTYKVLVRTFWKENKVDEAVHIVRDMEQRGIKGSASVYYELACCLCNKGRWQDAMLEIEKLKKLHLSKPLAVTFTGMIMSSMDGGHIDDCASIFEHMFDHCRPNIGTVNAMLKVYGRNDMFFEVKELFEKIKAGDDAFLGDDDGTPIIPDVYTYGAVFEASASAHQWEYFEYVYKDMCLLKYKLDQGKYSTLLWHLLEHAFETTLEAGEIPHPMVFTEMICQAMLVDEYEKAANIVNSMAHAPFQLNEKDWTDLFEKNKDRISDEHLKKLLSTLSESDMSNESTVSDLLKALHFMCSPVNDSNVFCIAEHQELLNDDNDRDKISVGQSSDELRATMEFHAICSDYDSDENDIVNSSSKLSGFAETTSDEFDCLCEKYQDVHLHSKDAFDEVLSSDDDVWDTEICDLRDPELPSANEILQSWKKDQEKDWTRSFTG
ncbi:hypothetical protein RDABS01_033554 [Bienertia sinuspersici]